MKKHTAITLLTAILVVLGTTVYGQQRKIQTVKEPCKYESGYWPSADPVDAVGTRSYSYYYDENDNKVLHGPISINAKGKETHTYYINSNSYKTYKQDATKELIYTATCKDGNLDGSAYLKDCESPGQVKAIMVDPYSKEVYANFKDGKACGTWKYNIKYPRNNVELSATINYENGKITGLSCDKTSFTLNSKGEVNGKIDGVDVKDGFANVFMRINGGYSELEDEQKQLLSQIKEKGITQETRSMLIQKHYLLMEDSKDFDLYKDIINGFPLGKHEEIESKCKVKYYYLKRIREATLQEIKDFCYPSNVFFFSKDNYTYMCKNSMIGNLYVSDEKIKEINDWDAAKRVLDPSYNDAISLKRALRDEMTIEALYNYKKVAEKFGTLCKWRDSEENYEYSMQKVAEIMDAIREPEYNKANEMLSQNFSKSKKYTLKDLIEYKQYYTFLHLLNDYKDSETLLKVCDDRISDISEQLNNYAECIKTSLKNAPATKPVLDSIEVALSIYKTFYDDSEGYPELRDYNKHMKKNLEECQEIKTRIINELKRIESLNEKLRKALNEIVEITKTQTPGYVSFKYYAPVKFYANFGVESYEDDYMTNEDRMRMFAGTLDERLSPFCPLIGYRILEIKRNAKNNTFIAMCEFDKKIKSKIGEYETYKLKFGISNSGHIIVGSFFYSATKVINDWDKLKDNDCKILAKSKECKNIVSSYSKYKKTAETTTNAKLKALIANQEKILKAINSSNAVELDDKVKKLKDKSIENVIKAIQ